MTDTLPDVPALLALNPLTDHAAYTLADGRVYIYDATAHQKNTDEFRTSFKGTTRVVGGTVIPAPAGGLLRLVHEPGVLRPEWYGDAADLAETNAVQTYAVLAHILPLLGERTLRLLARIYQLSSGLFYDGTGTIEGEGTPLNDQTRLKLMAPADYVLKMQGQGNRLANLTVDANRQAEYAVQEASAPYAERSGVKVTGATRDGVRLLRSKLGANVPPPPPTVPPTPDPNATNNDGQQWERCAFWFNGTAYLSSLPPSFPDPLSTFTRLPAEIGDRQRVNVPGTAAITAGQSGVVGAGTAWRALGIQPGDAIWIEGVKPALDFVGEVAEVVSDTEIRLRDGHIPNAQQTMSGRPFAILKGCGWRDERHNDNNICQLNWPFARGNAHAGVYLEGLYGHTLINGQYDYNGVYGIQVGGVRDDSADPPYQDPVFSAEVTRPYVEGSGYRAAALFYALGFTVTTPVWSRTEENDDPYVLGGPDEAIGVILGDLHARGGFRAVTAIGRQAP